MNLVNIYSGVEPLTNYRIINIPLYYLSFGTANHYYLILKSIEGTCKLSWRSKYNNTGKGEVVLEKYINCEPTNTHHLTDVPYTITQIYMDALNKWKNKIYNYGNNNCIKFVEDVCEMLGTKFTHPQLEFSIFEKLESKALLPLILTGLSTAFLVFYSRK